MKPFRCRECTLLRCDSIDGTCDECLRYIAEKWPMMQFGNDTRSVTLSNNTFTIDFSAPGSGMFNLLPTTHT